MRRRFGVTEVGSNQAKELENVATRVLHGFLFPQQEC